MWRTIPGLLLFWIACSGADDGTALPLRVVADIELPGDTSRFDLSLIHISEPTRPY